MYLIEITIQTNMKVSAALARIIHDSPALSKLLCQPRAGRGVKMSSVVEEVWTKQLPLPSHLKSVPTSIYEGCRNQVILKEFGEDEDLMTLACSISGDLFFRAAFNVS